MKYLIILVFATTLFTACSKEKKSDTAAEKMQNFVIEISDYARSINPDFIIIPQNGPELAFNYLDQNDGLNESYLSAIDGFGIEELFYNGAYALDEERLTMLQELNDYKKVLVAEFISDNANVADAVQKNLDEDFICFPRIVSNYNYLQIPDSVINENSTNINVLSDAQNYLYIISTDNYPIKQDMIDAISATNFDVVLIDLFHEDTGFTAAEIEQLKTKANGASRLVIAYMNIGSAENYRYYWKENWKLHHPSWLKKAYEGYEDEIWVKYWKNEWHEIIYGNDNSYTKKIIDAGFDGAYLDNVEAYYFLYYD